MIQRKLAERLYDSVKQQTEKEQRRTSISQAFEKGKSFITNAEVHKRKQVVINIDLEDFFGSFHFGRVRGYFNKNKNFEMSLEMATVIAQLVCYNGSLPQGAPTSPIITNLICNIFDMRLLRLAKKYRLDYTRYADDLTFSTNDKKFMDRTEEFMEELRKEILNSGFSVNEKKTRIQYRNSRQEVTGLVVNRKVNICREYYRKNRAMADNLYKTGEFYIDKREKGTLNQLEGRFAFLNQLENYNCSPHDLEKKKKSFNNLNGRERAFSQFLFYKYFFANPNPMIVTEGKTDVVYIKAALLKLKDEYPELIHTDDRGRIVYNVTFLKRSDRMARFLQIREDGADTMKNIYRFYGIKDKENFPDFVGRLKQLSGKQPSNAVMLLFDNEISNKAKPVWIFINFCKISDDRKQELIDTGRLQMKENLYLLVTPRIEKKAILKTCLIKKHWLMR